MSSNTAYQKHYYDQHRDELREKARLREQRKRALAKAFVSAVTPANAELASPRAIAEASKLQTTILTYTIPPLLGISTFLMIREMISVYSETWGIVGAALIALAIEGFTLLFSFVHSPSLPQQVFFRLMAVLLAIGSMYGMSAKHFATGATSYRADHLTVAAIADLETAIKEKRAQRDERYSKGYLTAARKLDRQIDTMRNELTQLRATLTHSKPASAVASTSLFEIFIRLALTLCNLVAAHLFGMTLKRFESFKAIPQISIVKNGRVLKFQGAVQRAQHLAGER